VLFPLIHGRTNVDSDRIQRGIAPDLTHEYVDLIVNSYACFCERMALQILQMKIVKEKGYPRLFPAMEARIRTLENDYAACFRSLFRRYEDCIHLSVNQIACRPNSRVDEGQAWLKIDKSGSSG
jgi:hypothetical protein